MFPALTLLAKDYGTMGLWDTFPYFSNLHSTWGWHCTIHRCRPGVLNDHPWWNNRGQKTHVVLHTLEQWEQWMHHYWLLHESEIKHFGLLFTGIGFSVTNAAIYMPNWACWLVAVRLKKSLCTLLKNGLLWVSLPAASFWGLFSLILADDRKMKYRMLLV